MKFSAHSIFASTALALAVSQAHAGLFDIQTTDDSFAGQVPIGATNDVIGDSISGQYNANLAVTEDVYVTFEYLGKEAAWVDNFTVMGNEVFWNDDYNSASGAEAGDKGTFDVDSGLVNFAFNVFTGPNAGLGVENGNNGGAFDGTPSQPGLAGEPNFFLGYGDSEDVVYIGLDDGGGEIQPGTDFDDADYDDLIVKATARVPEPASIALMAAGLLGIGAARRSKKS